MRVFFLILIIISSLIVSAQDEYYNIDFLIVDHYKISGFQMEANLELNEDNTFCHKVTVCSVLGGSEIDEFIGNYFIINNQIIFKPTYYIRSEYINNNILSKKDSIKYDSSIHLFRDTLTVIQWENRIYLLGTENLSLWGFVSKNDFIEFVNNINSGYYEYSNLGSYWEKGCICGSDTDLYLFIPKPWRDLLISDIIETKTTKVERYKSDQEYEIIKSIVTIDKGALDGVKINMKFYSDKKEDCECDIEIFEVNDKTSKGYAKICGPDDCHVGIQLSTYLSREIGPKPNYQKK